MHLLLKTQVLLLASFISGVVGCGKNLHLYQQGSDPSTEPRAVAIPQIEISAPYHSFLHNRIEDIYRPGQLRFRPDYHSGAIAFEGSIMLADIRLRGGIRFCDGFPHVKFKLKGNETLLGRQTYRLVSHGAYPGEVPSEVNAPACGNQLSSSNPSKLYFGEFLIYQFAEKLLEYALQTVLINVSYHDHIEHSVVATDKFGFLIEDTAYTAARYEMEEKDFDFINTQIPWTQNDQEEVFEAMLAYEFFLMLAKIYRSSRRDNPDLSRLAASNLLPRPEQIESFPDLFTAAQVRAQEFAQSSESDQKSFLSKFDQPTLLRSIWFNIMIQNTDWAVFGLNRIHSNGLRNFKFLSDRQGGVFAIPYDFDLAGIVDGERVIEWYLYQATLTSFYQNLRDNFGEFMLASIDEERDRFIVEVRSALSAMKNEWELPVAFAENVENFLRALAQTPT